MLQEIYDNRIERIQLANKWADNLDKQVFVNLLQWFIGELQKQYTLQEIEEWKWENGKFTPWRNLPHKLWWNER